jgi:hypothetical protein
MGERMRSKTSGQVISSSFRPFARLYGKPGKSRKKICRLENSHHYFLECVYIIAGPARSRLVVIHRNRILHDREYPTLREDKIAFKNLYGEKAWAAGTRSRWSQPYTPGQQLLNEKMDTPKQLKQKPKRKPK